MEQTIRIRGEDPHRYSSERFSKYVRKAYVNTYHLVTGDSFEIGAAYSLRKTAHEAMRFSTPMWWHANSKGIRVYVSKKTAGEIEENSPKGIFRSWEN